jgi:hypothetical protein
MKYRRRIIKDETMSKHIAELRISFVAADTWEIRVTDIPMVRNETKRVRRTKSW